MTRRGYVDNTVTVAIAVPTTIKPLRTFETRYLQRDQELFQLTITLKMALFRQFIIRAMTA